MKGRIVMITGANSGIGRATTTALAGKGAKIIMLCRNRQLGWRAMEEIKEESGNRDIDLIIADLSLQADIRRAAAEFIARYDRLHVLINNAGVLLPRRLVTRDGMEHTLVVNYLAPFLLTNLLLDRLITGAPSRIINVASEVQRAIDFTDLQAKSHYDGIKAYGHSKTALILFTGELARRLAGTGVTANSLHPGGVRTGIWRHYTSLFKLLINISAPMMKSPEVGAETPVYLASSAEVEGISGQYFTNRRMALPSAVARDDSAARKLWDTSVTLTKLCKNKEGTK